MPLKKSTLTIEQILKWADSYYERAGDWPIAARAEPVLEAPDENWRAIDVALRKGIRGLPAGLSLSRLLDRCRGRRNRGGLPPYRVDDILRWADAHYQRTGSLPARYSGAILDAPGETWLAVDAALHIGGRGLPGDSSLWRLLVEHRGIRSSSDHPPLSVESILAWADAHRQRTGDWPHINSGPITEANGLCWTTVDNALHNGCRSLPGGSSLSKLLVHHRGARRRKSLPRLTEPLILEWADAHFRRTGMWPRQSSAAIDEAPGETWNNIAQALRDGTRGFTKGGSLFQLLVRERGVRNPFAPPDLPVDQILEWADAHHARSGRWPTAKSGSVSEAPGENWRSVDAALSRGSRGLPGGSSLVRLLAEHRGVRNHRDLPPLSVESILAWADAYRQRTGGWPTSHSGPIPEAPGETWLAVDAALSRRGRGLPGGSSLARLLLEYRGVRNFMYLPPLSVESILAWVDAHHDLTGKWPTRHSGAISGASGEIWSAVDQALNAGSRGLPRGSSLAKLLAEHRGVRRTMDLPRLSEESILAWADAYRARTGEWPTRHSGPIPEALEETWAKVCDALRKGRRSLPGGSSIARLIRDRSNLANSITESGGE